MKMAKVKEDQTERYKLGEVATQTAPVIIDEDEEKQMSIEQAITLILNKLEKIENSVA